MAFFQGLDSAIEHELPKVHHRMCARHIYAAWAKKWRGEERKIAFWACAKSTFERQLRANIEELEKLGTGIVEDLFEYPMHQWVKAFFPLEFPQCDVVDNNLAETYNGWILEARCKPIISMLDEIRQKVMNRIWKKRQFANTWISGISPKALEKLEKNKELSYNWYNEFNGDEGFEITNVYNAANRHIVHLENKTCTCREWQLTGVPCQHAVCAVYSADKNPENFVSHWYLKDTYLKAYQYSLQPLRGKSVWNKGRAAPILPPPVRKMPGRPKKARRKDKEEVKKVGKLSRKGRIMTCKLCKSTSHNSRGCPLRTEEVEVIFGNLLFTNFNYSF